MADGVKSVRIEARIAPDVLEEVKRGAELQGRSISDFVVAAARAAARKEIKQTRVIKLSLEDSKIFAKALINPPKPNAALKRAFKRHKALVKSIP